MPVFSGTSLFLLFSCSYYDLWKIQVGTVAPVVKTMDDVDSEVEV
jgi:hypothetical protein